MTRGLHDSQAFSSSIIRLPQERPCFHLRPSGGSNPRHMHCHSAGKQIRPYGQDQTVRCAATRFSGPIHSYRTPARPVSQRISSAVVWRRVSRMARTNTQSSGPRASPPCKATRSCDPCQAFVRNQEDAPVSGSHKWQSLEELYRASGLVLISV